MSAVAFHSYATRRPERGSLPEHAGARARTVRSDQASTTQRARMYVPVGWPDSVLPPGAPDWERSATSYLLDCCPADYRAYPVLQRHPVVLARFAADFVEGQIRSSRQALAQARSSLHDYVPNQVLDSAAEMLQSEEARLVRTRRSVALIEESLRGKIFIQKI